MSKGRFYPIKVNWPDNFNSSDSYAKPNFLKLQNTSYFLPERQYECKILNDRKSTENIVFQSFSKINGN